MKLIYIAASTIPSQSANSIHVIKMCQAFALNGHKVTLLIPNKIDRNIKTDDIYGFYGVKKSFKIIKLFPFSFYGSSFIFAFLGVLTAKKEKPDLIYTRFLFAYFFSLLLGLPAILEVHAPFTILPDKLFFNLISRKKIKRLVVISNALKIFFIQKYKISENRIIVAPDGADPIDNKIKPEYGIKKKEGRIAIGYVGSLYKGKGMEIIAELAKQCPWAIFHIIGGLPEDLNFWEKKLASFKNIIFHGHIAHGKVYKYMLSFDILLAPYQKKVCALGGGNIAQWMSPLKIFEYMATGKAILSSNLPVLKEILEHDRNCLLAFPQDIERWILNLKQLKEDSSLRERLGKTAKQDFEEKYTWKARAEYVLKNLHIK